MQFRHSLLYATILIALFLHNNCMSFDNRPDFVLFIADDLSLIDAGCYGNGIMRTPYIHALAEQGIHFAKAYTTTAMCTPSRSAIYSGQYPQRNGAHMNHGEVFKTTKSLPNYLQKMGYRVALSGKKHIAARENFPFKYIDFKEKKDSYGAEQIISPNIDKLASQSVLFDRAHYNVPFCGATRASLLTVYGQAGTVLSPIIYK